MNASLSLFSSSCPVRSVFILLRRVDLLDVVSTCVSSRVINFMDVIIDAWRRQWPSFLFPTGLLDRTVLDIQPKESGIVNPCWSVPSPRLPINITKRYVQEDNNASWRQNCAEVRVGYTVKHLRRNVTGNKIVVNSVTRKIVWGCRLGSSDSGYGPVAGSCEHGSANMAVFWVVASCNQVEVYQRFGGPCCLHHQGDSPLWKPQMLRYCNFGFHKRRGYFLIS
jgi:hypothetical protein